MGLIGLIFSSLSAHAIKQQLTDNQTLDSFHIAQNLLLLHAIIIIVNAILAHYFKSELYNYAAIGFIVGITLFATPIFLKGFNISSILGFITPFGGLLMMISWIIMIIATYKLKLF